MPAKDSSQSSFRRVPSSEEVRELGQILSLLHTTPPRTVFSDQDTAWRAVVAARELHRRTLWGTTDGKAGHELTADRSVDTAIQLITILLDAAERLRRDGNMEEAAGMLCDAIRHTRAMRLLIPFLQSSDERSPSAAVALSRLCRADAEVCMRLALLLVPARGLDGELIGLLAAYALTADAVEADKNGGSNDWQASQMIGLVRDAIGSALSWQRQQERVTESILDGIRYRAVYDEAGSPLESPQEIRVHKPIAADAAELEAKVSARNDLTMRFGDLGEAQGSSEDDACLPPGAGVMFQCWVPCIEAFVTASGQVRLRIQDVCPEQFMIRELSLNAMGEARALDIVRLDTSQELHAVLRMLQTNVTMHGVADKLSGDCLPALQALCKVVLSGEAAPPS